MNECYIELSLPFYPLVSPVEEFIIQLPNVNGFPRLDRLLDIEFINPDLLQYFKDRNISIRENFILWNWAVKPGIARLPHTDGDWRNNDNIRRRTCGINWNFTPGTRVEFYSREGATPVFEDRGKHDFSTSWENCNNIIDIWDTPGPVLFNPQIPHDIKSNDGIRRRISLTLRFNETFESLKKKLNV